MLIAVSFWIIYLLPMTLAGAAAVGAAAGRVSQLFGWPDINFIPIYSWFPTLNNVWPFDFCTFSEVGFLPFVGSFFNLWCGFQFHTSFVLSTTSCALLCSALACPLSFVACVDFTLSYPDALVLMAFIIFSLHVDFCAAISQEKRFVFGSPLFSVSLPLVPLMSGCRHRRTKNGATAQTITSDKDKVQMLSTAAS